MEERTGRSVVFVVISIKYKKSNITYLALLKVSSDNINIGMIYLEMFISLCLFISSLRESKFHASVYYVSFLKLHQTMWRTPKH